MAEDIILKIGTVDMSEYCDKANLTISKEPVFKTEFTAMNGKNVETYFGVKYNISANFTDIPNDIKISLETACSNVSVSITFGSVTQTFKHPSLTCTLDYITSDDVQIWSINFSSACDLVPGGL